MIAFPIAVWFMTTWGWLSVFYTFGLLGIVWSVLWYFLLTSRHEDHPTISSAELAYIQQDRPHADPVETVPWRLFFSASAFWALLVGRFCALWTWYMFLARMPIYLVNVWGFSRGCNAATVARATTEMTAR